MSAAADDDDDATDSSSSSPPLITNLDIYRNAALKALEDNDDVEAERLFDLILHLLDVERKQPPSKWARGRTRVSLRASACAEMATTP
jgi:hypothetical protein